MWTIFSNFSVFFLMVLTGTENFNILNVKRNWIDRIIITPSNSLCMNPHCSILAINTVPDRTYLGGDYCRRCHLISFRFFKNTIWTNSFYLWKVYSFNFIEIVSNIHKHVPLCASYPPRIFVSQCGTYHLPQLSSQSHPFGQCTYPHNSQQHPKKIIFYYRIRMFLSRR